MAPGITLLLGLGEGCREARWVAGRAKSTEPSPPLGSSQGASSVGSRPGGFRDHAGPLCVPGLVSEPSGWGSLSHRQTPLTRSLCFSVCSGAEDLGPRW